MERNHKLRNTNEFYYQALDDIDEYNQEFLAQLNHADEKIRFVALMNIGDEENPDLLPWLHAALQHDSSALVREEAAKTRKLGRPNQFASIGASLI